MKISTALLTTLLVLFTKVALAGFDEHYQAYSGDLNGDGYTDIYIRQTPQIVLLHGDIITPIVIPADINEFVLQQNSNQTFSIVSNLSPTQKTNVSQWSEASVELELGDFNIDGVLDIQVKKISNEISGVFDQIVFAPIVSGDAPTKVTAIDNNVKQLFKELYGRMLDSYYFERQAIVNGWYEVIEGDTFTAWWSVPYLHLWGFTWNNGAVDIRDTNIDDADDPDASLEICTHFSCYYDSTAGFWRVWAQAIERDIEYDYSHFNQDAITINNAIEGDLLDLDSGVLIDQPVIENVFTNVFDIETGLQVAAADSCDIPLFGIAQCAVEGLTAYITILVVTMVGEELAEGIGEDDYDIDGNYGGYTQIDEDDALDLANSLTGDESCELLDETITALENRIRGRKIDYEDNAITGTQDAGHLKRIAILEDALRKLKEALENCTS